VSKQSAEDAYPLLRCPTQLALSHLASQLNPLHWYMAMEWCHSHLKSCHFQSALFSTDSQSALTLLSTAPAFFQLKSFWDIWDLSDSLSSRVLLSFQWVHGHAGLPGNELTESLTKTGATLPFTHIPNLLASTIANIRTHSLLFLETKSLLQLPLMPDSFGFLGGTGPPPSHPL